MGEKTTGGVIGTRHYRPLLPFSKRLFQAQNLITVVTVSKKQSPHLRSYLLYIVDERHGWSLGYFKLVILWEGTPSQGPSLVTAL